MVASATAGPWSGRIIVVRLPRLSTHAPACSPNSRLGSHCSAVRYPIPIAPACSTSTAVSGTAIDDTWSPNTETVDAPQYRRNTLSRSNGGTRSRRPAPAFIAIKAYGRNRDNARVTGHLGAPACPLSHYSVPGSGVPSIPGSHPAPTAPTTPAAPDTTGTTGVADAADAQSLGAVSASRAAMNSR